MASAGAPGSESEATATAADAKTKTGQGRPDLCLMSKAERRYFSLPRPSQVVPGPTEFVFHSREDLAAQLCALCGQEAEVRNELFDQFVF